MLGPDVTLHAVRKIDWRSHRPWLRDRENCLKIDVHRVHINTSLDQQKDQGICLCVCYCSTYDNFHTIFPSFKLRPLTKQGSNLSLTVSQYSLVIFSYCMPSEVKSKRPSRANGSKNQLHTTHGELENGWHRKGWFRNCICVCDIIMEWPQKM